MRTAMATMKTGFSWHAATHFEVGGVTEALEVPQVLLSLDMVAMQQFVRTLGAARTSWMVDLCDVA